MDGRHADGNCQRLQDRHRRVAVEALGGNGQTVLARRVVLALRQGDLSQAGADVKKVTIRQLLEHKSGFKKVKDCTSPKDLERLLTQPLAYKAGTHYAYDNNNFYIARLVLEQIGHVHYTAYVKEHVLNPLGITRMETRFQARQPTCGYGKLGSRRPGFRSTGIATPPRGRRAGTPRSPTLADSLSVCATTRSSRGNHRHDVQGPAGLGHLPSRLGEERRLVLGRRQGARFPSRHVLSSIFHFPDDVNAVMFINSDTGILPEHVLAQGLDREPAEMSGRAPPRAAPPRLSAHWAGRLFVPSAPAGPSS